MAKKPGSLKVKPFTREHVPNPFPDHRLPWHVYHTVRNALVTTSRQFGPVGPMGTIKIDPDVDNIILKLYEDPTFWKRGDPDPSFFILDDQLNHERYCYVELHDPEEPLSEEWLLAISQTLDNFEGWGLVVTNIPGSSLLIFGSKLMVKGRLAKCKTIEEVVETAQILFKSPTKKWWQFWR